MTESGQATPRCAVLVGNHGSGKSTLFESLLRRADAGGNRRGHADTSREAKAREMTVEPNIAQADFLGDPWTLIDCPGSIELIHDAQTALMGADIAVVVAEPDPAKALTLAPIMRFLDAWQIPHLVFVNQMDRAEASVRAMAEALQAIAAQPLVMRQIPIRDGERITGYVDLVSERAYRYREAGPSDLIAMPEAVQDREDSARQVLLESLADLDDALMEKLIEDVTPPPEEIFAEIRADLQQDLVAPLMFGAARQDRGVTRLWKALRHDAPAPAATAARLGVDAAAGDQPAATVLKTFQQVQAGKLSLARIWQGQIAPGHSLGGSRLAGLVRLQGGQQHEAREAGPGDVVALARMDALATGDLVTAAGDAAMPAWPAPAEPVHGLAVAPAKRADEVKLTSALSRLIEEDPAYSLAHDPDSGQMVLWGQGEIHTALAVDKLQNRYNVAVVTRAPQTAYRETIRTGKTHHTRFKRQTGGHGQFADIHIRVAPQPRGAGFTFTDSVVGGAIPRQFIPAVEAGLADAMQQGPLGFPVVDIAVELVDGQYHSVDSSEHAFRTAGRIALAEALPACEPVLLEPVYSVTIATPNAYTNRIHGLVAGRRGRILGFAAKAGWPGWDSLSAYLPGAELTELIVELRSLTQGVGFFERQFDHMQEVTGKAAQRVFDQRRAASE